MTEKSNNTMTPLQFRSILRVPIVSFFVVVGLLFLSGCSLRATSNSNGGSTDTTPTATPSPKRVSADDEFKQLQERRLSASPSESEDIIKALSDAESRYTNDYRFPYERAKLLIKGRASHDPAFEALNTAAEKAIDNGKAQQMLDNITADKEGDFYKLSRGHHEWAALLEALTNKNKTLLKKHGH